MRPMLSAKRHHILKLPSIMKDFLLRRENAQELLPAKRRQRVEVSDEQPLNVGQHCCDPLDMIYCLLHKMGRFAALSRHMQPLPTDPKGFLDLTRRRRYDLRTTFKQANQYRRLLSYLETRTGLNVFQVKILSR